MHNAQDTIEQRPHGKILTSFPKLIDGPVYLNGHNAVSSYGANSYFIKSQGGNWLVDSPRFDPALVEQFRKWGGIRYIFLTHRDDVADADRYARAFGADRIIHEGDRSAQPDAEMILKGDEDVVMAPARLIHTPGHTRGHGVLLWNGKYLFTGDHLSWSPEDQALRSGRDYCWYSWKEQTRSVEKLARHAGIEWVLPGHGGRKQVPVGEFPKWVQETAQWMKGRT
ncbi:MAG TPA: MBL fold metallo-hydrolase [Nitrospiria bacterium]|nr:MBL fold metallo-hydrolase [Nitrospiria bacterium]